MSAPVAAIDIGGTKIGAALVDPTGSLIRSDSVRTPAGEGPEAVLDAAAAAVDRLTGGGEDEPVAAGVGSAGVIDPERGLVLSATDALPGWPGTAVRDGLRRRLGVPVVVDNDVHAHARGELWLGAARGVRHALLVAAGTGIGASLIAEGRILRGGHPASGHLGHVPVPAAAGRSCGCGGTGHAEAIGGGPAMLAEYHRRGGAAASLAEVAERAAEGEERASDVLAAGATALGQAVGGVANVFAPGLVLIGGGVSHCGPAWWEPLRAAVSAELLPPLASTRVAACALGSDAALLGAAHMALEAVRPATRAEAVR